MHGLRISQLAERAGVATSTVRYYERIGLLPGPARTESGYRTYDDEAEAQLLFIARSKRLGLSLDEIAELMEIWGGTNCGDTQERLAALLTEKQREVAERIDELGRFADQLTEVQARLAATPSEEGCAPDLNCCAPRLSATPITLSLEPRVVACTLTPDERPARAAEFAALSRELIGWSRSGTTLRLRFPARAEIEAEVRELMRAEEACCAFLTFALQSADDDLIWEITAPDPETGAALDEFLPLLGEAREAESR